MWWRSLVTVSLYHIFIGVVIVVFGITTEKSLTITQKSMFVLEWPITVSATNYMQLYATRVMDDTKQILEEINSGRWERKQ